MRQSVRTNAAFGGDGRRRFENLAVLITGGGSGIGKATAERFAAEGANVAVLSNAESELVAVCRELQSTYGVQALPLPADVIFPAQIDRAVDQVVRQFGKIDILFNNAGVCQIEPFLDISEAGWMRTLDVNLNGMFRMAQRVAREMIRNGGGTIINMASTNGLRGEIGLAHYNASKGGVVLLTKTMALELAPAAIRVNAVCPGYIHTTLASQTTDHAVDWDYVRRYVPLGRPGEAKDVAGAVAFLASEDAAFITGECLVVDGGQLSG